ncbi:MULTISPECIES: tyrosine--tRNA ligase [Caulobacter]|jgi:tyrosyl-tRNA synthetase|uniref:Tyrosine--tRNA ligase n=1 Tax=Caulobacter rhizosphaerae TaxID=2010972 RepID=A0ABU1N3L4_9CAUL|nr:MULTISPECIES: tyrosine--tRNA ligase [Caulobacter]KQZ33889.1 tyrosine--tRNA ligase [Caulobacter sp. Root1472]MDR6532676.1 tyrosyl-tRNA synthetase [Caulobacter rhizosphaerae]GGL14292.1 tyrosine--tRNA ligase [Caulobacter rhizosphaerae]
MSAAASFKSEFLQTLQARGYIHQITHPEELDAAAAGGIVTAYIGFDATAPSLHVGSLIQIMMLRRLQQAGHKPIVLMGGGTTKVGDPTGKDESRKLLSDADIAANIAGIKQVFARFLTFGDGPTDAIMVDNDEWLSKFGYVQFLRDYGVHFTVNRMLAFDSVKLRLEREQPMTFLEFNYMLMQATDFLELNRKYGCVLQMGGSDQWGNILNGVELTRRVDQKAAFGLTTPLLATASGAKMGKTMSGAVWLNAEQLSPYDYWQFWRNTEDADVGRFLKLFTDLPLARIAELEALPGAQINEAKKVLADEATRMAHGEDEARKARDAAEKAFEQGALSADLPTFEVAAADLKAGIVLANLFADAGLAASRGEARRLAQGGGVKVNDKAEPDANRVVTEADLVDGVVKLAAGKKKIVLVKPV